MAVFHGNSSTERRCKYLLIGAVSLLVILILFSTKILYDVGPDFYTRPRSDRYSIKPPENTTRQTYDILLIGYLRGGSTFLGEILGLKKNNFYVFEPLHKIAPFNFFKPGYKCEIGANRCHKCYEEIRKSLEIVTAVYTCQYNHLAEQVESWQLCKAVGNKNCDSRVCNYQEKGCAKKMFGHCSDSVSRVSKVARMSISLAKKLLKTLSNLKIVHLFRDPRAILNSRKYMWGPLAKDNGSLCQRMKDDYEESMQLKKNNPNRIHIVFYEDLAIRPVETVKAIYNFAGYAFNNNDLLRLQNMTRSSAPEFFFETFRHDSSKTAHEWRSKISFNYVQEINEVCGDAYRVLGYPEFADETELHDSSIPLRLF